MTESIYLALFVWTVVYFAEFIRACEKTERQSKRIKTSDKKIGTSLMGCAWCLAGTELTRYDGWFLAGAVALPSYSSLSDDGTIKFAAGCHQVSVGDRAGSRSMARLQPSCLRQCVGVRQWALLREGD